ncbi:hypothetical protein NIES25_20180 [Nostoc linckia NIES-25]|nr:hypothetical protein NIES25_20180 [Nostoc linckia NIES-25]
MPPLGIRGGGKVWYFLFPLEPFPTRVQKFLKPHPQPLPLARGGETKRSFDSLGFLFSIYALLLHELQAQGTMKISWFSQSPVPSKESLFSRQVYCATVTHILVW